jgi:phage baseplate assembly protein W
MEALEFPFVIRGGKWQTTRDLNRIVRGQVIDAAMTNFRERAMRPIYGSDAQSFVLQPQDTLVREDAVRIVLQRMSALCPRAIIDRVNMERSPTDVAAVVFTITFRASLQEDPVVLTFELTRDSAP